MKIKISQDNSAAIDAVLAQVNGRASQHTASSLDIIDAARRAEANLAQLGLPKAERSGASFFFRSGDKVAHAYAFARAVNHATLQRGASAWYLVSVIKTEVQPSAKPSLIATLTAAQDAEVIRRVREGYSIAAPAVTGGAL